MSEGHRSHPDALLIDGDEPTFPVYDPSDHGAENSREQEPTLQRQIDRQREKIEADIYAVHWITSSKGHLKQKAQEYVPLACLRPGNQKAEDNSGAGDHG